MVLQLQGIRSISKQVTEPMLKRLLSVMARQLLSLRIDYVTTVFNRWLLILSMFQRELISALKLLHLTIMVNLICQWQVSLVL